MFKPLNKHKIIWIIILVSIMKNLKVIIYSFLMLVLEERASNIIILELKALVWIMLLLQLLYFPIMDINLFYLLWKVLMVNMVYSSIILHMDLVH